MLTEQDREAGPPPFLPAGTITAGRCPVCFASSVWDHREFCSRSWVVGSPLPAVLRFGPLQTGEVQLAGSEAEGDIAGQRRGGSAAASDSRQGK